MHIKISVFVIIIVLYTELASAQFIKPADVPFATKVVLDSLFPEIKTPIWKKVSFNPNEKFKYEATATYNYQRVWATIDDAGNLYVIEKALDKKLLPLFVDEYIANHHPSCVITDSRQIFLSDRNLYLIVVQSKQELHVVRSGQVFYSLLFAEDGTCLGDKSNLIGLMTSFVASSFKIPNVGQFKPFKLRDRIATIPKYDFK